MERVVGRKAWHAKARLWVRDLIVAHKCASIYTRDLTRLAREGSCGGLLGYLCMVMIVFERR